MKGAPLDHMNSSFAFGLGLIYDHLITSVKPQDETALPSKSILLNFFGSNIIILSTFILIGLVVGLGTLVWAGRILKRHYDEGRQVSVIVLSLLLTDVLELVVIPVVVTALLNVLSCYSGVNCIAAIMTFGFARQCGYCFHQLVALESILALRKPDGSSRLSTPRYAIPVSLLVWIWTLITLILGASNPLVSFIMGKIIGDATIGLTITSSIYTCIGCSKPERKPGNAVTVLAVCTLVFVYGPFIVWFFLLLSGNLQLDLGFISIGIMSFRLVTDPLLCVLVCKIQSRGTATSDPSTSHTPIDEV